MKVNYDWAPMGEWAATVDGEYDGAPDGGGVVGFGRTKEEALEDLLNKRSELE